MANKKVLAPTAQKRKPRLLWANPFCLMDNSSGASMTVRQMLLQLVARGYEVQVLGATVFDNPKGMGPLKEQFPNLGDYQHQLIEAEDGPLAHQLVVSYSHDRNHLTTHEEGLWYGQYLYLLDTYKPDIVWFYGGQTLDMLIADEARDRGIPVAFYLANGNYKAPRWCRDVDLILCDSQATADMYRQTVGYTAKPVGKFIAPERFVAETRERKRLLFVNPSWQKGASVFVQLAERLERERPGIELEVVEARADWAAVLRETTRRMGQQRSSLSNVTVTANTSDMRGPYGRARVLAAPSLWWESSGRVLAEAMLNGIPALITKRGGMPEMIDDAGITFEFPETCYEEPHQQLLSEDELQPLYEAVIELFDNEPLYQEYVERAWRVGEQKHHIDKATERLLAALTPLARQRAGNKDFSTTQKKRHRQSLSSRATKPDFKVDTSLQKMIGAKEGGKPQTSGLWLSDDFTWQLKSKVIVLDNRAKLLKNGLADQLIETGAFGLVAFDPASEVPDVQRYEGSQDIQVFQHALLGDGESATLYACVAPEMTGTLKPLSQDKLPKHHHLGAQLLAELPISTIALDNINGLESLDWLILDGLSDAMAVLQHGKASLRDTLLIQARIALQPTHEQQPNLSELQHWASRHGFRFYRFNDFQHYSHLPKELQERSDCATEQESAEVLFLPSHERMSGLSDERKKKLAFILSAGFGAHDVAYELMADVDESLALKFLEVKKLLPVSFQREEGSEQGRSASDVLHSGERLVRKVSDAGLYARKIQEAVESLGRVRVVQVGANDGCINDPIYDVVMKNKDKTEILLIEPQENIIPYLKENYSKHPAANVANYAVGPYSTLVLYRIKPSYYKGFTKRYLLDSPSYRVPSGFSSFDKEHVVRHAQGNLPKGVKVENAIERLEVPCRELSMILDDGSWKDKSVDVLQVDAEGMDDAVIYSCNIEITRPKLINFERSHLPRRGYLNLCNFLKENGYELIEYSPSDSLAVFDSVGHVAGDGVGESRLVASDFKKEESTYGIVKRMGGLYEFSRKVLSEFLGGVHGLKKSERFWEILLHYFLGQRFVIRYLSRWNNGLLNDAPDWKVISESFPCQTFREYMNLSETLVGEGSPYVTGGFPSVIVEGGRLRNAQKHEVLFQKEMKVVKLLDSYESKGRRVAYNLGVHNSKYWKAKFKDDGVSFVDFPAFDTFTCGGVDWEIRKRIAELDVSQPAEGYEGFWASMALCLPTELLEDFLPLYDAAERVLSKRNPEFIFSALLPNITSRLVAAILAERSAPLYLHQHGGAYGEYPSHHAAAFEKRVSDKYYTWGWKDKMGKAVPERPHRLHELKKSFSKIERKPREILLIAPQMAVVPEFMAGTDLDPYDEEAVRGFYSSLSQVERERVVIRLRRQHGFSESEEKRILRLFPEARVDDQNRSIEEAYANAEKVVIVMPFTTSAWECEYLGIPYQVLCIASDRFLEIPSFIPEEYE